MSDDQVVPETSDDTATDGIQQIPAQIQVLESPTVAVARERLIEAIGREAGFLADHRAGQASEGLEALARAFTLVTTGTASAVTITPVSIGKRDAGKQGYDAYEESTPAARYYSYELPVDGITLQ
ncbi:hypothetical protein OG389_00250 [Streptomyces sp. NBC_00435]|uniref:hypothetical protein n=1 Tax=Streptomyces sp. NBC_00435 TaxID=2903649 RepID=UPI002E22EB88